MRRTKSPARSCRCVSRLLCLLVLLFACGAFAAPALGRTFWDAPPTRGLFRPTAYNLFRGEVQVQLFAFSSVTDPFSFFEVEYGLSDALQLGTRPVPVLFGDVRLFGKYRVGTTGPVSLAVPFGAHVLIPTLAWRIHGGWVLSWQIPPLLTLHPGIEFSLGPATVITPYLGATVDVGANLKLVLELDGEEPYVDLGALLWLFGFVKLQVDFSVPWDGIRISITGRF